MNAFWFTIYAILIVVGAIGAITFPIIYTIKFPWWRSEVGIHVFSFSGLFAILYSRSIVSLFNPVSRHAFAEQSSGNIIFTFFIVILAAAVVWQRIWIFFESRIEEKEQRRKKGQKTERRTDRK
jgi:hypothetical protein